MTNQTCDCCSEELRFQWSDRHGVGVCINCGLPYVILHYEDDKRIDKPPECYLNEKGLEIAKRYWSEKHRRVFPAYCDMGFLSGRERSYSGATQDDCREFSAWYEQNIKHADAATTSE